MFVFCCCFCVDLRAKKLIHCTVVLLIVCWALICHCHVTLTIITCSSTPLFYLLLLVFVIVFTLLSPSPSPSPSLWCGAPALKRPSERVSVRSTHWCAKFADLFFYSFCKPKIGEPLLVSRFTEGVRYLALGGAGDSVAIFSAPDLTIANIALRNALRLLLLLLVLLLTGTVDGWLVRLLSCTPLLRYLLLFIAPCRNFSLRNHKSISQQFNPKCEKKRYQHNNKRNIFVW